MPRRNGNATQDRGPRRGQRQPHRDRSELPQWTSLKAGAKFYPGSAHYREEATPTETYRGTQ